MSRLAEDARLVEVAAKAYARQQIDPDGSVGTNHIWKVQRPEVKRGYRDRAIEVLVAVDLEIERLARKEAS